jgi:tetratricopeptide (TPR) repeat protein
LSLNNLAGLYNEQGKYPYAEPLFRRALAISEKALGRNHPNVATSLENLAQLYREIGHADKAKPLATRAAAIRAAQR